MKSLITIFLALASIQCMAQDTKYADTYICKDGKTHFYASTPLEDISPTSNSTACAINVKSKKISAKVEMKSFVFKNGLMQEHFNENYIESDKYPYATLDAQIVENLDHLKDGTYTVMLKGIFEIHGVKKEREIKGKLTVKDGQPVSATAEFEVRLTDHNIKIPTAVMMKIAEVVKVDVNYTFKKY